jgi:putative SOS response-associated peptidase YedK
MCNLHRLAPKEDLERYIRQHVAQLLLPEWPLKSDIGPFDEGLFLVPDGSAGLVGRRGQWGMIRPGQPERIEYKEHPPRKPGGKPRKEILLKNNSRIEGVAKLPAFRDAWKQGRRCLIPADWLQEPNWESGKCVWWRLKRADGLPWMVAGIWSEWTDPTTGEIVPNYAMLTFGVNDHPLLSRLHKPDRDRETGEVLPLAMQDKRGEAHIEPHSWMPWLNGSIEEAAALLVAPPDSFFDQTDAQRMDDVLSSRVSTDVGATKLAAEESEPDLFSD